MKDNAGKHFAAHLSYRNSARVPRIPSQKHPRKCHGIIKVIQGKLRKRFMH